MNSQKLLIRPADRNDYLSIQDLCLKEGWNSFKRDDITFAFDNSIVYAGFIDDQLVAYIRALTDGFITVFVCELIVAKEYRNQGFGRELLNFMHDLYPLTRTDLISEADGFYEAAGFRKLGSGFRNNYRKPESVTVAENE